MKIIVDSSYCVISIDCEDRDTRMTIDIKNEMSLTNDENEEEEA